MNKIRIPYKLILSIIINPQNPIHEMFTEKGNHIKATKSKESDYWDFEINPED